MSISLSPREMPPTESWAATSSIRHNKSAFGAMVDNTEDLCSCGAQLSGGGANTVAQLRAAWDTAEPIRTDYGNVVTELNAAKLGGKGSVLECGTHVPVKHMGFFKPPADALLVGLRQRDQRSAKEWEYVNCAGVWAELGMVALEAWDDKKTVAEMGRRLKLSEMSLTAVVEVLNMCAK